ncbi:MAG: hypothetical protein ACYSR7_04955 [Planctomycetota bacterium]|jgi:hypothetical protein
MTNTRLLDCEETKGPFEGFNWFAVAALMTWMINALAILLCLVTIPYFLS